MDMFNLVMDEIVIGYIVINLVLGWMNFDFFEVFEICCIVFKDLLNECVFGQIFDFFILVMVFKVYYMVREGLLEFEFVCVMLQG